MTDQSVPFDISYGARTLLMHKVSITIHVFPTLWVDM